MNKKIKVAHVLKCMDMGGIETLLMNFYRNIDREKVQFIFILLSKEESFYEKEIKELGGIIYHIGGNKNFRKQIKTIRYIIRKEKIDVVHSHTLFYSSIVLLAAKLEKVKIRIAHSHSKNDNKNNNLKRKVIRQFSSMLIKKTANVYMACSKEASEYLYGKKMTNNGNTIILKNGIEPEKYLNVEQNKVEELKNKYNIKEKKYIIVMVARLAKEKNHRYAINIAKQLKQQKENFNLFFVGSGPLEQELKKQVQKEGLEKEVIFTGLTQKPEIYFKISDVAIVPSEFEGFGITILEAQATKKLCIVSNNVPKEADLKLGLVKYLNTTRVDINKWIEEIKNSKKIKEISDKEIKTTLIKNGFDISETAKYLLKIYQGEGIL